MTSTHRKAVVSSILAAQLIATNAWAQLPAPPPPPSNIPPAGGGAPPAAPPSAGANAGATPTAAPALSPVPAPTPAEMQHRRVPVTVDSTHDETVIERRVSTQEQGGAFIFFLPYRGFSSEWEQVCVSPCRVELDRYSTYRVSATNGVTSTHGFTLPQGSDSLRLHVDAGNLVTNRIGKALVGIGSTAIIVGASLLAAAHSFNHEDDARLAGYVTGGAGIVVLGVGIPLVLMSRSKVTTEGDRKLADGPSVPIGKTGASLTARGIVF